MAMTGQEFSRCAYPGCENELRPGEAAAEPGYCGLPDPVTGEPHTALTAFRRRQVLAGQGGGMAGPEDADRPGFAFWRRAGTQRRQRAEAEAKGRPPPDNPQAARAAVGARREAENTCRPRQEHPGPHADGGKTSCRAFLLTRSVPSMTSTLVSVSPAMTRACAGLWLPQPLAM